MNITQYKYLKRCIEVKALVVYATKYGNTEKAANLISQGITSVGGMKQSLRM